MAKKYYGYFVYDNEEYVIRFRIKGSLSWNPTYRCFEDKDWSVRSAEDMICYAALDAHPVNVNHYGNTRFWGFLISHEKFKKERARGVKRWNPQVETIKWD